MPPPGTPFPAHPLEGESIANLLCLYTLIPRHHSPGYPPESSQCQTSPHDASLIARSLRELPAVFLPRRPPCLRVLPMLKECPCGPNPCSGCDFPQFPIQECCRGYSCSVSFTPFPLPVSPALAPRIHPPASTFLFWVWFPLTRAGSSPGS